VLSGVMGAMCDLTFEVFEDFDRVFTLRKTFESLMKALQRSGAETERAWERIQPFFFFGEFSML